MNLDALPPKLLIRDFSSIISASAQFLARHGVHKNHEISNYNYDLLLTMNPHELERAVCRARRILDIHLDLEKNRISFYDSANLAKTALRHLGLAVSDNIYNFIRRGDIVEIYDQDHIQVFGSFNFFQICNYNLDDILLHPWYSLYERNNSVTDTIMRQIQAHLKGLHSVTEFSVPTHIMREKFSTAQGIFATRFKMLATVYTGPNRNAGFLCTIRGRRVPVNSEKLSFI